MKILCLSSGGILAIHEIVIELSGGADGIREPELLESTAIKPQSRYAGRELYPDIYLKAAVLFEALINYHVFIDGNKRTAFASMARFLFINNLELCLSEKEIVNYCIKVATNSPDLADIAIWIKTHSAKIS